MTDYDKFKEFFIQMGIIFDISEHIPDPARVGYYDDWRHGKEPEESIYNIAVSQAIFCFDKYKRYIGVVGDEMGYFTQRKT